jgi:hypothetical protein
LLAAALAGMKETTVAAAVVEEQVVTVQEH